MLDTLLCRLLSVGQRSNLVFKASVFPHCLLYSECVNTVVWSLRLDISSRTTVHAFVTVFLIGTPC